MTCAYTHKPLHHHPPHSQKPYFAPLESFCPPLSQFFRWRPANVQLLEFSLLRMYKMNGGNTAFLCINYLASFFHTHLWYSSAMLTSLTHDSPCVVTCRYLHVKFKISHENLDFHEMWSSTRCEVPWDVKCHETYHVHGDWSRLGLWLSTKKSTTIAYIDNQTHIIHEFSKSQFVIKHISRFSWSGLFSHSPCAYAPNNKIFKFIIWHIT